MSVYTFNLDGNVREVIVIDDNEEEESEVISRHETDTEGATDTEATTDAEDLTEPTINRVTNLRTSRSSLTPESISSSKISRSLSPQRNNHRSHRSRSPIIIDLTTDTPPRPPPPPLRYPRDEPIIIDLTKDDEEESETRFSYSQESNSSTITTNSSTSTTTTNSSSSSTTTSTPTTNSNIPIGNLIKCAICLEYPTNVATTYCGHLFCYNCINRAASTTRTCSICRRHLKTNQITRLEFKVMQRT
ncbi:879_t:CDS:2 [Diversispora eburnea]|uniref:879_t:CDS:1 n=1 Tax=Diversispora eburnea TaxID=1213867 RepID=A0A9N9G5S9_9GLOM|nr:879_t:CDS:2 [Diversispora eburnea]